MFVIEYYTLLESLFTINSLVSYIVVKISNPSAVFRHDVMSVYRLRYALTVKCTLYSLGNPNSLFEKEPFNLSKLNIFKPTFYGPESSEFLYASYLFITNSFEDLIFFLKKKLFLIKNEK